MLCHLFHMHADIDQDVALIYSSMQEYETLTCVRFINQTTEIDYLDISAGGGCYSFLGRTGGAQSILFNRPGCMYRGIIQHELQHALGFYHEISRSDRDEHVLVNTAFVDSAYLTNFAIVEGDTLGLPYDYNSVMHYDKYAFTNNSREPTIIPIPNPDVPIGQRYGLSVLDIQKLNKVYNCDVCSTLLNEESGNFSSTNFPSGYPNNMNCSWLIRVPYGQVALTFKYFNIQNTAKCLSDYIRIYDGPTRNQPLILDKICGTVLYPTIISSTSQMLIEFISDGSVTSEGFNASYTTVPCGGFYSGTITQFTSPGYSSGVYPPNMKCNYLIYAPPESLIQLSGTCELEAPVSNLCRYDILTVYGGGYVGSKKYQYCGTRSIPLINSTANQMLLTFVSDNTNGYKGFLVNYSFVQ